MPKTIGGGEHGYGDGSVIGHVDEDTSGYGICFGSDHRQDQADQEDHEHWSPGEHKLRAVQQGETERGHEDGDRQTEAAREYGIEESAKEEFFHQRRQGNAEDAERPGFGGSAEEAVDRQLFRNRQEMGQALQRQRKREAREHVHGDVGRPVPVDGGEKIGAAALPRHQNIHVGEDEKVGQRLSRDDDQRDASDFAETRVRVDPPAGDEQHGKHAGEERHDGEKYEAEDIPAIPRGIGQRSGDEFGGRAVGKVIGN